MAEILTTHKLKKTKNRQEILDIIKKSSLPVSAEDIYKQCLENKSNINLSTIYRTLSLLEEKGVLIKQVRNDGKSYFQENKHDHKHLFVCNTCGKTIVLPHCPLEEMVKHLEIKEGFTISTHNIELYGTCKKCLKKNA